MQNRGFSLPVRIVAGLLATLSLTISNADEASPSAPGHSLHGDAFDEGPRQKAYLMEGMPKLHFPVTTSRPEAQKFVNQGVGQLHGFWYFEAERSFRHAAMLDTNIAMAYWGMAMANVYNEKRARSFVERAVQMTNSLSRRECLYIDSLAKFYGVDSKKKEGEKESPIPTGDERHRTYVRSLEQIVEEFPDDIEAKAFLAFKIWDNGGRFKISSHTATDALAKQVLAVEPMHPVHHARIHLWNGEADRRALDSAARCGQGSAAIAHMWHMPGHTYSGLHRYADSAWQQEASARVDHAYMMRNHVLPDQIHNYAHNNEWLVRNLSYLGRVHDAIDLAKNLIELPRHPKYNSISKAKKSKEASTAEKPLSDTSVTANEKRQNSAVFGRARLLETLVRWELWDELIQLDSSSYLERTDLPEEEMKRLKAVGVAYFNKGNIKEGERLLAELEQVLKQQKASRIDDVDEAEAKGHEEKHAEHKVAELMAESVKSANRKIKTTESALAELKLYRALAKGEKEEAIKHLESAKDIPKERLSQVQLRLENKEKAEQLAREALEKGTNQVQILANYIEILSAVEKQPEAEKAFETLRTTASLADLDSPILKRLRSVADKLKLPEDWRHPYQQATDVGDRPPLDNLGPFRWSPSPAPDWVLKSGNGKEFSLKDYRGKPLIMVFYLGHGCSHCLEQLNAFAPVSSQFEDAGISLVAVSTDSVDGLKKTLEKSQSGKGFQFPIVSDETLKTFKAFRAFDDFEDMPLHGTFLIDGQGLVRWKDIGFEPFMQPEFLLKESQRLLKLSENPNLVESQPKQPARSPRGKVTLQKRLPKS